MDREQAWTHYFQTRDREPLIKAYWDSIAYIAWSYSPDEKDDMTQVGLIGLLKAIDKIDVKRVKSKDSWVYLKVRSEILKARKTKEELPLHEGIEEPFDLDTLIDLRAALKAGSLDKAQELLSNYKPTVVTDREAVLRRFRNGELSRRGVERELGISARQAYKLIGTLPKSW